MLMAINETFVDRLCEIAGRVNVSNEASQMYCYSFDASTVHGLPDVVVRPHSTSDVSKIVALAHEHRVPVVPRGAGSGLSGGAVAINGGVVLDLSGMSRILEVDVDNMQVRVECGVVHKDLNNALAEYGFFFPPDPGSSAMCTIGGLVANNGSGMRCVKYGTTKNYVLDLEVVMADGRVVHTGSKALKTASGYDLTRLMIGSEGTLGVITAIGLKIHPLPGTRRVLLASFDDTALAGKAVVGIMTSGVIPSACEILDRTAVTVLKKYDSSIDLPDRAAILLIEVDGSEGSVKDELSIVEKVCCGMAAEVKVASSEKESDTLWAARRLVGAAVSRIDPKRTRVYAGEDIGVPIKQLPRMLEHIRDISQELGLPIMTYGHIGDGNLHTGITVDLLDENECKILEEVVERIHQQALSLGGTVSAEHGIGRARARYMEKEHPDSMWVMKAIKKALDPCDTMNPGKMGL